MDTRVKGQISERKAILKFIENGFNVYEPVSDSDEIDFVVEKNNNYFRIQSKTAYYSKDQKIWRCSVLGANHREYAKDAFDYFAITVPENDDLYIIPKHKVTMKNMSILRDREFHAADKWKNTRTLHVKDYLNNFNLS